MNKLENLHTLSIQELNQIQLQVKDIIRLKQPGFRVGMKVGVDHKKVMGMIGEIIKVNNKKVKVDFDGQTFSVPKSMIIIK
jgi:FKBP-type peptidyl-prolyl cis-trans isomerase 2